MAFLILPEKFISSPQAVRTDLPTYHTSGWEGIVESLLHIKILPPVYSYIFLFWQPTPVILPGDFYGQRSLVGYSSWGCKELDTTERLTLSFLFFYFCARLLRTMLWKVPLASWKWWSRKLKKAGLWWFNLSEPLSHWINWLMPSFYKPWSYL